MYEPIFNSVLVQIDDKDAKWGSGNDDSMLGKSYRMGTIVQIGKGISTQAYPVTDDEWGNIADDLNNLKGRKIMWNEGVEAGTIFDFDDKKFGMIYWWDIRAVLVDEVKP